MFSKHIWSFLALINAAALYPTISKMMHDLLPEVESYSYIASDYPMRLPLPLSTVESTFSCSSRFTLNDTTSREVWTKSMDTRSGGFVRLGPDYRVFAVSMYHQLHCMAAFQYALTHPSPNGTEQPMDVHVQHCLNYLRQFILCAADDTREPPVKVADLKSNAGCAPPVTRQCRNWETLYKYSATNYLDFHEFKVRNGTWTCRNSHGQDSTPKETPKNLTAAMMAVPSGICDD